MLLTPKTKQTKQERKRQSREQKNMLGKQNKTKNPVIDIFRELRDEKILDT